MKIADRITALVPAAMLLAGFSRAPAAAPDAIRLNQIGFYPAAPKVAAVVNAAAGPFHVVTVPGALTVFTGELGPSRSWSASGEAVRLADFSALREEGTYALSVPGLGESHAFEIRGRVLQGVAAASMKGFYFQRMSIELVEAHAGKWKRRMGHPDDKVRVHASAATDTRPENTLIACPRGWYDAGDYNKYIVNSGISVGTLLSLYEHFPEYAAAMELNIPESGDGTPDLLDEILWNLRWMLAMQDPGDGGVYHKCTNANFDGMVMPHQATSTRYVVQKSTAAALDFAAVMAQAARILDDGGWSWAPTLADSCLAAALSAWEWAWANPDAYYRQGDMNALYNPDINTGEYGDGNVSDEFDWAAMELFATTGDPAYLADAEPFAESSTSLPGWPNVRTLGYYSLLHLRRSLPAGAVDTTALKARVLGMADWHKAGLATSPYGIVMGRQNSDFGWGSNSQAANQAVALILAFRMTADSSYLWAALSNLDYLLGRNATGYSFVTGWGDKTPLHIHHRPSEADGVRDPVPGLLAGGPNPRQEDGCAGYPSKLPAVSYVDAMCSYASNEICINWNAPLVFAAWAMEALLAPDGRPDLTAVPEERPPQAASGIRLRPNFPNPFNASTSFDFRIDRPAGVCVTLTVYDAAGRRVAECLRGERFEPGAHRIRFEGGSLPSGAYLYRLEADGEILGGKMALVK